MGIVPGILVILFTTAYLSPAIIATFRKHKYDDLIFVINFFFGWTVVAWIGCYLWPLSTGEREAHAQSLTDLLLAR